VIRKLLVCSIAGLLIGCAVYSLPRVNVYDVRQDEEHPPTYGGISIHSGQLVLTESPEPTSFVFMLIPDKFYCFTHAGIIVMENGEPWVYEVSGELATFPVHERVLDNVSGKTMRRRLFEYTAASLYTEIIDPPEGVDGEKVSAFAREQYKKKTPFDPYFRWDEHDSLFCTELVELALRAGGARPTEPGPALEQPSLLIVKRWLGVPTGEALPAGFYHNESRMVAAMGQFRTRGAAFAYFEAKRELYRRFSKKDQRMGYVFKLRANGTVELRDDVAGFLMGIAHLFDGVQDVPPWGDPHITHLVKKYADQYFGPPPD
jgi:hypothetical protein